MKNRNRSLFGVLAIVVLTFALGACGNSKQKAQNQQAEPAEAVIETETIVVEVDSVQSDTASTGTKPAVQPATQQKTTPQPKPQK